MDTLIGQKKPAPASAGGPAAVPGRPTQPPAGPATSDIIVDGDQRTFMQEVIEASRFVPVLVDFWADWCGPCKMIAPALEEISEELAGKVKIAKMDIMENTDTPSQIGVQSIPLMVLYKNGKPVAQKLGAAPKGQLKAWLESEL